MRNKIVYQDEFVTKYVVDGEQEPETGRTFVITPTKAVKSPVRIEQDSYAGVSGAVMYLTCEQAENMVKLLTEYVKQQRFITGGRLVKA